MKFIHLVRLTTASLLAVIASLPLAADQQRAQATRSPSGVEAQRTKIDLNTANEKTLAAVPVIGPELARTIVATRPFTSIDELQQVEGMSAERLEQIRAITAVSALPEKTGLGEPTHEKKPLGAPSHSLAPDAEKINVNTADVETLAAIPGIGPELAREIVAVRPFRRIDELNRLKGMSAERLEQIRAQVAVPPARARR